MSPADQDGLPDRRSLPQRESPPDRGSLPQRESPLDRESLLRLLDYTAKWATAELLSGLLQHPKLYDALAGGATVEEVAARSGLTPRQAGALLRSLEVEEVLERRGQAFTLTGFGRSAASLRGWLDLFVRGYGGYFHRAPELWGGTVGAWRDTREVGLASARMSEHDAIPLVASLVDDLAPAASMVADMGCADGSCLLGLCERRPGLRGVGLEPEPALAADARRRVTRHGLDGRVEIVQAAAQDWRPAATPDVIVFGFVLQELVEQTSEADTVALLRLLGRRFPSALLVAVEVDAAGRADLARMRAEPQRRGYYNYYYLLHDLTEQRLLTVAEWRRLFGRAELEVVTERTCDPAVDDTGLTVAFALRHRGPPSQAAAKERP